MIDSLIINALQASLIKQYNCGRRRGTRTPSHRIWNPALYHWSYSPIIVRDGSKIRVSSLYARYAHGTICSICALKIFQYASFCFLKCDSYVVYTFHNPSEYFHAYFFLFRLRTGKSDYAIILDTTPAPTVRPPSRIAKRVPSSIAIGLISSALILTLSPGITISVPS